METAGFFISILAFGLETLILVSTLAYMGIWYWRGNNTWSQKLWAPVVLDAIAGAVALAFSIRYVLRPVPGTDWVVFVMLSALFPLLLAIAVVGVFKYSSKNNVN